MDLLDLAQDGVKRALAKGADAAEVYVARSRSVRVAAAGRYAMPTVRADDGVAVRLAVGSRAGSAGAESFDRLDEAIADALASAARPSAPASHAFPAPRAALHAQPFQAGDEDRDGERALDTVERAIDEALRRPEVTYAQAELRRWQRELAIANSSGVAVADAMGGEGLDLELRVSRGASHLTTREGFVDDVGALPFPAILDDMVARARDAFAPSPISGVAVDHVILHAAPASQLLALLGASFSGTAIGGGKSPLPRALGQEAFSPLVSIADDPRGRRAFDDEGTPTRLHPLVEAGRVVGHLHDAKSAAALGVEPTGHGYRAGILGGVSPRPRRLVVAPGEASIEELVEAAPRAVLVTEPLLGSFASDKVTSDFSVVAPFAFYVEEGRVRHALPPTTIGGNAHAVFRAVRKVGRDARAKTGGTAPPILAGGVTCAT